MSDPTTVVPEDGTPVETPAIPTRPETVPEKFWNAETGTLNSEALLASYTELEKARSKPAEAAPVEGGPVEGDPNVAPPAPKGADPAAYTAAVDKATAELQGETGAISEETFAAFEAQGVTREQIATHIEGQTAMFELRKIYAEREVGGEDVYAGLLSWAASNYSAEEAQAYNDTVFGSNREAAITSVRALKARYEDAMGIDGKIITSGTESNTPGGYTSKTEWLADIRKPEYKKDPAQREAVRRKLETALKNGVNMGVGVSAS